MPGKPKGAKAPRPAATLEPARPTEVEGGPYEMFGPTRFSTLERRLARGGAVSDQELARALRTNPGRALPAPLLDYVCRRLEGAVGQPRAGNPAHSLRRLLAPVLYKRYLAWLQGRRKRRGLKGWKALRNAEWWRGPPHERAARMVARRLFPNHTWRHVRNLISSEN